MTRVIIEVKPCLNPHTAPSGRPSIRPSLNMAEPSTGLPDAAVSACLRLQRPDRVRDVRKLLDVAAAALSGGTRNIETFDWASLRADTLREAIRLLSDRYSPSRVNNALAALRVVLQESHRLGRLTPQEYLAAMEVRGLDRTQPTGHVTVDEANLRRLFEACDRDQDASGVRDAFVLLLVACAGVDRQDIIAAAHLNPPQTIQEHRCYAADLTIRDHPRRLLLGPAANAIVSLWVERRGIDEGPAVCAVTRDGRLLPHQGISEALVHKILHRRAREAGIAPPTVAALKWHYRLALAAAGRPRFSCEAEIKGLTPANATLLYVLEPCAR